VEAPAGITMPNIAMVAITASVVAAAISICPAITVVAMPVVAIAAVIPRSCSDKDSAAEPRRAVVSIGSTCIWRITIVSIRACRRTVHIRAYADADRDLRVRVRRRDKKHCKQGNIS
jgi:hypothetical protein